MESLLKLAIIKTTERNIIGEINNNPIEGEKNKEGISKRISRTVSFLNNVSSGSSLYEFVKIKYE